MAEFDADFLRDIFRVLSRTEPPPRHPVNPVVMRTDQGGEGIRIAPRRPADQIWFDEIAQTAPRWILWSIGRPARADPLAAHEVVNDPRKPEYPQHPELTQQGSAIAANTLAFRLWA